MKGNSIDFLLSQLPIDAEWVICVLPGEDGKMKLLADGLTSEETVRILYRCADSVIEKYIPPSQTKVPKSLN